MKRPQLFSNRRAAPITRHHNGWPPPPVEDVDALDLAGDFGLVASYLVNRKIISHTSRLYVRIRKLMPKTTSASEGIYKQHRDEVVRQRERTDSHDSK